jgi:hypothetical protein
MMASANGQKIAEQVTATATIGKAVPDGKEGE